MQKKAPGRALGCRRDIWAHAGCINGHLSAPWGAERVTGAHPRVPAGRHPHTLRCGKGAWARTLSSEGNIPRQRHSNLINFDPRRVAGGPPGRRRECPEGRRSAPSGAGRAPPSHLEVRQGCLGAHPRVRQGCLGAHPLIRRQHSEATTLKFDQF